MPIWAMCLEWLFWLIFPVVVYYFIRLWMSFSKFNRVYDLTENAQGFGRVDELRVINLETARIGKRFIVALSVYMIIVAAWTYLWVVPHAKGVL